MTPQATVRISGTTGSVKPCRRSQGGSMAFWKPLGGRPRDGPGGQEKNIGFGPRPGLKASKTTRLLGHMPQSSPIHPRSIERKKL